MEQVWKNYQATLERELGDELAAEFVSSLYTQCKGDVTIASRFFYTLGARWAPLMHAWSAWIEKNALGTIAIIMRDSKPLTALPNTLTWKRLYLNRVVCGVSDELSGDESHDQNPLLAQYLKEHDCNDAFTFVDSGCYGTVVLELYKLGVHFKPLFFFSKNPHIPGFLNEAGVSLADGEILNDSLECGFPHLHLRPTQLVDTVHGVDVALHASDVLSVYFGESAMCGVRDTKVDMSVSFNDALENLLTLSREARAGSFTGILGHSSPEWSKKKKFLDAWPQHLCWT